jgi:enamine deaminase RidA (YjgF/YER057c/UK114 family)
MDLDVRGIASNVGREIYITARPEPGRSLVEQGEQAFGGIASVLRAQGAWLCQERVFTSEGGMELLSPVRGQAYGELDDRVAPTWLVASPDPALRGVQVHALVLPARPEPLSIDAVPYGRLIQHGGCRWITASGLPARGSGSGATQARTAFEQAESLLKQAGGDLGSVARTWFFLDRILDWYDGFNDTRSRFLAERRLLGPTSDGQLPASTGIGVPSATSAKCLMEMIAVVGDGACTRSPTECVCKHPAAGKQQSAYEYGSSFARASTICSPAGRTVFVSGTAAIDARGATCHVGDVDGQIRMALDCTNAVLDDLRCPRSDVVQAVGYCKTAEVEARFRQLQDEAHMTDWPWLIVRGDVCRDDLLFEAEVTACVGAGALA